MANPDDVFNPQTPDVVVDLGFNDLVGEGRKYKDPDELAKAYAHIEAHVRKIEAENARIRAERDTREANPNPNPNPSAGREQEGNPDPGNPPPQREAPKPDPVDFRSQIREEVRALNETERAVANMEAAAAKLVEIYGNPLEANKALQARANELGVSVDWLRDSAGRSPKAFYASMGITEGTTPRSQHTPSSGGGHRLEGGSEVRNFEYFEKIRKDNPKLYFSATTQREMMAAARTMGSDFYKR